MNHHYRDITDAIGRQPLWFDEHAVPRYSEFTPDSTANIYADEAVLLLILCQGCGTEFKVCMSDSAPRIHWAKSTPGGEVVTYPPMVERVQDLHYGDPPNMGCCGAGPTMNSVPRRVLEFWKRDRMNWERVPELEVEIECDWWDGDDV